MTDKEYREQKKRFMALVAKWRDTLGLAGDRLRFTWFRVPDETSPGAVASVNASWQYRNHNMNVYLTEVLALPDDELEDAVIHELSHLLIHPATGNVPGKSDAEIEKMEYATTSVAYAIKWAYEAGKKNG